MTFAEAVEYLDSLHRRKWREGQARMRKLLEALGLEEFVWGSSRPRYIHVAGTNGKGSVCAFLQSAMRVMRVTSGVTASPYVYDVRERVQVGDGLISHEDFARYVSALRDTDGQLSDTDHGPASAFEMKTALAFLAWKEKGVEAAAVEVGIGGRLDATNVVQPACTIVVSIGWDHMELLGDTLDLIAREKAGIFKTGIPALVGDLPEEAMAAVEETARSVGAPLWTLGREIILSKDASGLTVKCPQGEWTGLRPGMAGRVQEHNAALALAGLAAAGLVPSQEEAREGVALAQWPGRFEEAAWEGLPVILDGAHNVTAAENLALNLAERFPDTKIGVVTGMLRGHEPGPFWEALRPVTGELRLVDSPGPRGQKATDLLPQAQRGAKACGSFAEAFEDLSSAGCQALCVTGSFYILSAAKEATRGRCSQSPHL